MDEIDFYKKAMKRVQSVLKKPITDITLVAFLEKEIDDYRDKIEHKDSRINELILQCDALTPKEPAETFTTEQASDGGVMTLSRKTASWKLVTECLLTNGYFVCCHFDDEDEIVTIEYFRA